MMKKGVLIVITALTALVARGQESQEVYSFLRLPVSAHVAALGGNNITITDDDPSLIFHNPSLISNVTDKSLNLNFMTYMEGAKTASASFVKAYKERGTWVCGSSIHGLRLDEGNHGREYRDRNVLGP